MHRGNAGHNAWHNRFQPQIRTGFLARQRSGTCEAQDASDGYGRESNDTRCHRVFLPSHHSDCAELCVKQWGTAILDVILHGLEARVPQFRTVPQFRLAPLPILRRGTPGFWVG
jgi:hypothetical protein